MMTDSIPRIIHQTWKTESLPDDFARYRESVRALHPGWEHRLWTDDDNRRLISEHYPWFLDTYDSYKHNIERVDAVRYFILLRHGGLYLDLDMECLKPIDDMLQADGLHFSLLAGPDIENTIIGNALMAAPKGHAFFSYLTKKLSHLKTRDITFSDVFNNTGPDMLSRQIRLCEPMFRFNIIGLDKVCDRAVLSQNPALEAKTIEAVREEKLLYFIHHGTNVWNIQHPVPTSTIEGFVLFENFDIQGCDIDYVDYTAGDYDIIAQAAADNPDAIAFNFNGYIKGHGGRLSRYTADGQWVRPGITPWICVKKKALAQLAMSDAADRLATEHLGSKDA